MTGCHRATATDAKKWPQLRGVFFLLAGNGKIINISIIFMERNRWSSFRETVANGTAPPEPDRAECYCFQYFTLKFLHKPKNNGCCTWEGSPEEVCIFRCNGLELRGGTPCERRNSGAIFHVERSFVKEDEWFITDRDESLKLKRFYEHCRWNCLDWQHCSADGWTNGRNESVLTKVSYSLWNCESFSKRKWKFVTFPWPKFTFSWLLFVKPTCVIRNDSVCECGSAKWVYF